MPRFDDFSPPELEALYAEHRSVAAAGRHLGITTLTMRRWLRKAGVKIKRSGYASPKSTVRLGEDAPNWKGGTTTHSGGYVYEWARDHPSVAHLDTRHRYVLQHRLVMEAKLGRYMESDEDVHHINEDKTDNRPENLELTNRSEHMSHHRETTPRDASGRFAV